MNLLSEDTLAHYGTPGMKKGVRHWQYPDGRFTPEGKERYFGTKSDNKKDETKFKGIFDNEPSKYEIHENFMVKNYPGERIYRKKDDFFNEPLGTIKNMRMVDKNGNYTKEYSEAYNSGKNIVERFFSDVKPEGSIFGSKSENIDSKNQKEQKLLSKINKYLKKVEQHQYKESKIKGNLFLRNAPVFEIISSYHNWRTNANYKKYIKNKNKYEKITKKGGIMVDKLFNNSLNA